MSGRFHGKSGGLERNESVETSDVKWSGGEGRGIKGGGSDDGKHHEARDPTVHFTSRVRRRLEMTGAEQTRVADTGPRTGMEMEGRIETFQTEGIRSKSLVQWTEASRMNGT